MDSFYMTVYNITTLIPSGMVSTYGRIAAMAGSPRAARAVGYALHSLPKDQLATVPWQRVINSRGKISSSGDSGRAVLQKKLLLSEGIIFGGDDTVSLKEFGWPR